MDTYTVSFTLPRPVGTHAFLSDPDRRSLDPSASTETTTLGGYTSRNGDETASSSASTSPQLSRPSSQQRSQQQQSQPPQPPQPSNESHIVGRLGSMRSRFPPSVKSFMPMAFGRRASERIAEVTSGGEKEDENTADPTTTPIERLARSSSEWRKSRLRSTSSLPLSVPEEGPARGETSPPNEPSHIRDSRSTAGTRSSFEFPSSAASFSADSTAPSSAANPGKSWPTQQSDTGTHSKSASVTTLGPHQPLTLAELNEATNRLTLDVMNATHCLVSCSMVQDDLGSSSTVPLGQRSQQNRTQQQALPFPSNYPYQHYAQGFGQDASNAFPSPFSGSAPSFAYNPAAASNASLASSISQHQPVQSNSEGVSRKKMPSYNFHLSGTIQQVLEARSRILRDHPFRSRVTVKVPKADVMEFIPSENGAAPSSPSSAPKSSALKPHVRSKLDEIAHATNTHVSVAGRESKGADLGYGLETERSVEVVISGQIEGVEHARIQVLVMLDELAGLTAMTAEIDQKFHNIIGGRKRAMLQTIQEQTATSIYVPLPLSANICSPSPECTSHQNTIYITGDFFGVQRARDMLAQIFAHKAKSTISRDTAILPRKIDWMLADHLEDLRQIMIDNGTFIGLPALGSQSSVLTVFGDNRVSIERTTRTLMALACQFYIASVWLLPVGFNGISSGQAVANPADLAPHLKATANRSGAEVVFKANCFEFHGLETEVKAAVGMILDLDVIKSFNFEVRFQIELATSEREFLQGRKCGKVNKIMKQCGVRIKFETFNDFNFLIELSSNDRQCALQGLALLQEELPAEVSFHVPETYHKRCIGVGGKQIQKVMKKYGVYVKFSNAEEFAALGGYIDNEDNVIARTPAKNAINLENLKQSVMEMVNPKDKDFTTETVTISRRYHRSLLGEKGIFIHDIEGKCSSKIIFPPRETASDLVAIFGPESQIHMASAMLLEHVPFEADFRVPNSSALAGVVGSQEFSALAERVKRDLSISIVPTIIPSTDSSSEAVFKLRLSRSNSDFLPTAKDLLEDFLVSRNINVYAPPSRARSDSFASAFPHFANKLISTPDGSNGTTNGPAPPSAASAFQADLAARLNDNGRLRGATSTPALKALFDSPTAGTTPGLSGYPASVHGSALPTPSGQPNGGSPLVPSSLYSSPYTEGMPPSLTSSDVWGAPRNVTTSGSGPSLSPVAPVGSGPSLSPVAPVGAGITFPSQHAARQSDDVGMFHRGGADFFGNDAQAQQQQLRKPRSYSHRAQSLDISSLNAQQAALEASAYLQSQSNGVGNGLSSGVRGPLDGGGNSGSVSPAFGPPGGYSHHMHAAPAPSLPRMPHASHSISYHGPSGSYASGPGNVGAIGSGTGPSYGRGLTHGHGSQAHVHAHGHAHGHASGYGSQPLLPTYSSQSQSQSIAPALRPQQNQHSHPNPHQHQHSQQHQQHQNQHRQHPSASLDDVTGMFGGITFPGSN
ncbi:unnamed protein product [Jaminaea pallidilutea]